MIKDKYSIIADTSVLQPTEYHNFNYFEAKRELYNFVSFIKDNPILKHIKILITRMSIEELKNHQIEAYSSNLDKMRSSFEKFKQIQAFQQQIPDFNYEEFLNNKLMSFLRKYNIEIIEVPTKDLTKKLIQKVLNKEKPFYKKKEKDSGFKDAIIWESILEYSSNHKDENIIFWCADGDFYSDKIIEEFKAVSSKKLIQYKNSAEIKKFLDEEYNLHINLQNLFFKIDNEFYNNILRILSTKYGVIRLNNQLFNIKLFQIKPIVIDVIYHKDQEIYTIVLPLIVTHETEYTGWQIVEPIYEYYQESNFSTNISVEVRNTKPKLEILDLKVPENILR